MLLRRRSIKSITRSMRLSTTPSNSPKRASRRSIPLAKLFTPPTTEYTMAEITYREALNQALREEIDRDACVFIMGKEVGYFGGAFKVTDGLLAIYGEKRVRDTPDSDLTIVGSGIGAAMGGLKPIVELMTIDSGLLAIDQIINNAAKIHYMFGGHAKVPVVIRAPQGAGHQLGAQ